MGVEYFYWLGVEWVFYCVGEVVVRGGRGLGDFVGGGGGVIDEGDGGCDEGG